ncbi:MAG: hypothetical protein WCT23_01050 [Candidatus Neomarinimicrobiota bacterium]|jgi:hypothetical protein
MDISSFELLEKKLHQALGILKDKQGDSSDTVILSKDQVKRITEKLAQISEWIDHAEV